RAPSRGDQGVGAPRRDVHGGGLSREHARPPAEARKALAAYGRVDGARKDDRGHLPAAAFSRVALTGTEPDDVETQFGKAGVARGEEAGVPRSGWHRAQEIHGCSSLNTHGVCVKM